MLLLWLLLLLMTTLRIIQNYNALPWKVLISWKMGYGWVYSLVVESGASGARLPRFECYLFHLTSALTLRE